MTWEELIDWVRTFANLNVTIKPECARTDPSYIVCPVSGQMFGDATLFFRKDGNITIDIHDGTDNIRDYILYKNRTPDQMYQIITALTETKESK